LGLYLLLTTHSCDKLLPDYLPVRLSDQLLTGHLELLTWHQLVSDNLT